MTRRVYFRLFPAVACLVLAVTALPAATTVGLASLRVGLGSRECGMGDAGVASARGPLAMYWNPALSAWDTRFAASASYSTWLLDMSKAGLFALRPTRLANLGLGVTAFSAGRVENRPDQPTEAPLGYYEPADYSLYLSLSRPLAPKVAMGLNGRLYYQRVFDATATAAGVDIGLVFLPLKGMKVGVSVLDFATETKFKYADFTLPARALGGVSYVHHLGKSELSAAADLGYGFYDHQFRVNTGAEFVLNQVLALRAGYKLLDPTSGLTAGIGLRVKGIRVEYSFGLHELDLNATHRFALGLGY
jgi:hypothetical protein